MGDLSKITPSIPPSSTPGGPRGPSLPPSPLGSFPPPPPPPSSIPTPKQTDHIRRTIDEYFEKGSVSTGKAYQGQGVSSIKRRFARLRRSRAEKNISKTDTNRMERIIREHATALPTGHRFPRKTKKAMREEAYRQREKIIGEGGFTQSDYEDFKRILKNL